VYEVVGRRDIAFQQVLLISLGRKGAFWRQICSLRNTLRRPFPHFAFDDVLPGNESCRAMKVFFILEHDGAMANL